MLLLTCYFSAITSTCMNQETAHHFKDWSDNYLYENRYSKKSKENFIICLSLN